MFAFLGDSLELNIQVTTMQIFAIEASQINGLLRDYSNGLYRIYDLNFDQQINITLERIQSFTASTIFNPNAVYKVSYRDQQIQGNLN